MKKAALLVLCGLTAFTLTSCTTETTGKFHGDFMATDTNGIEEKYYQFRSNDDEVYWLLTESEIGFVPKANEEYTLVYDNNGTTKCNCDVECECYLYDDIFVEIR